MLTRIDNAILRSEPQFEMVQPFKVHESHVDTVASKASEVKWDSLSLRQVDSTPQGSGIQCALIRAEVVDLSTSKGVLDSLSSSGLDIRPQQSGIKSAVIGADVAASSIRQVAENSLSLSKVEFALDPSGLWRKALGALVCDFATSREQLISALSTQNRVRTLGNMPTFLKVPSAHARFCPELNSDTNVPNMGLRQAAVGLELVEKPTVRNRAPLGHPYNGVYTQIDHFDLTR